MFYHTTMLQHFKYSPFPVFQLVLRGKISTDECSYSIFCAQFDGFLLAFAAHVDVEGLYDE